MRLTKAERETIILFSETSDKAEIYTFNTKLKNKLTKLSAEHHEEISLLGKDDSGSITYSFPKKLISIRKPVSTVQKRLAKELVLEHGFQAKNIDKHRGKTEQDNVDRVMTHLVL